MNPWLQKQENILTLILIIFYSVGLAGMYINTPAFALLSPFNLLLTAFLLFKLHPRKDLYFWINLSFIFSASFILEMFGVSTGSIFGAYKYGSALGLKLENTPLIIGLNWVIVAYSALLSVQEIALKFKLKLSELSAALMASTLMVLLDFLIEPLAPALDFWSWNQGQIPIQNYTAWFFFGFAFCYWMLKADMLKNNPMGWRVYLAQFVFFLTLHILI